MSRKFKDWIEAYVEFTNNSEPRESYRRWAAVSAIAAALQRKCFLPWGQWEVFYPNFYIILVGPPAARKGTAMRPVRDMLERLGIPLAADETSRQKLISRMIEKSDMRTDDEGVTHMYSSITIFSSELTVFLKRDDENMLPSLCKWYDCEAKFEYDTLARGVETVTNVWVNLFGATTPTLLQTALPSEAFGSGFTSRTIFVYEEDKGKIVIFPGLTPEQAHMQNDLLYDLEKINIMCGRFKIEQDIIEPYTRWRYESEENPPFKEPKLATYLQRRATHLLKLCIVFSASRSDERVIRLCDFNGAMKLLLDTERKMPWVFRGVGNNPLAEVQTRIMRVIIENEKVSMQELHRLFMDDVSSRDLWQIIAALEYTGFCKMDLQSRTVSCTRAGNVYGGKG